MDLNNSIIKSYFDIHLIATSFVTNLAAFGLNIDLIVSTQRNEVTTRITLTVNADMFNFVLALNTELHVHLEKLESVGPHGVTLKVIDNLQSYR